MIVLPAPRARAFAALELRCAGLTEPAIAVRLRSSTRVVKRDLAAMREWYGVADTASAAYLHGRTQGRVTRRRRVRDDEPTLPW